MKENKNWTNKERVENYTKLLSLREWMTEEFEAELVHLTGNFRKMVEERIKCSKIRIDNLKAKIEFFGSRPGESTEMPEYLMK
jgi:hypothetical protein